MSNVHGLFSGKNKNDDDSSDDENNNNRFVGGIDSRGGGRCVCKKIQYGWHELMMCFARAVINI